MREQWGQINEILASALELDPAARFDFVREACGDNDALRVEIESLLSASDSADSLLENSPAAHFFSFPGTQIGAYRVLREIGHGGMAVVYLAERSDQEYRKRVAIKMIRPGGDLREVVARFRKERQTLAALDHPNIVKLLDGGTTEDGWPYLVMDFVEGLPIDQYCEVHEVPVVERLGLFRAVCDAVHYAHQHMVIHRDLKPTNILVSPDGMVRLLDFGIAKLLDAESNLGLTTGNWRPMTPEYASPEQRLGAPVTFATDIYSLGVLLCELLTAQRVYAPHGGLKGDLDAVVGKALRDEPERRYASAQEFSADIGRYLAGEPVKARRSTFVYRLGKFLRRHKEAVTAAVAAVIAMSAFMAWETYRVRGERVSQSSPTIHAARSRRSVAILGFKNLSGHRDVAWLSTALSEMLATELAAGEKLRIVPGESVARARIDLSLPEAESLASDTLERVRKNLGSDFVIVGSYLDLGGAGNEVRVDLRVQDTHGGETVATVSETATEQRFFDLVSRSGARLRKQLGLGELSQAEAEGIEAAAPSNPEAMRLYSQGLERLRTFDALAARDLLTHSIAADPQFSLPHSALAKAWQSLGYDANAAMESRKALELSGKLSREDYLLVEARSYEGSKEWEKAMETYRTLYGFFPDNLNYGLALADVQTAAGKGKEALKTLAALAASSALAKEDPRVDLARADAAASVGDSKVRRDAGAMAASKATAQGARLLVARARATQCRALANLGENEASQRACQEAMEIYSKASDRGGVARTLHSMAEVPLNQDDLDTAEKLYQRALAITREIGDKQGIGRELVNLGVIARKRGDFARAQALYEEAYRNDLDAGDKNAMAVVTGNMGNLLRSQGKVAEAVRYYGISMALSDEVGHRSSSALALSNMGWALASEGELAEASKMLRKSLAYRNDTGEQGYYSSALAMLGDVLKQQGDLQGARKAFEEALAIQQQLKLKGEEAETRLAMADLACDSDRAADGEGLARAALATFQSLKENGEAMLASAVLSNALVSQGKADEARTVIEAALPPSVNISAAVRLTFEISRARVLGAMKDWKEAERVASQVVAESHKLGLMQIELQARLAVANIQLQSGRGPAGRASLQEVEAAARRKGFLLIAQKAGSR